MKLFTGPMRSLSPVILATLLLVAARGQSTYPTPYAVTTLAGASNLGSADGTGSAARFNTLTAIVADSAGNLYVADTDNHIIRKVTPAGVVTTFAGAASIRGTADGTGTAARFYQPRGIAIDAAGNLYVSDSENYTIRKITSAGVVSTLAGSPGSSGSADGTGAAARFDGAGQLTVDASGNVFVADTDNHTIRKITPAGVVTTVAGTAGSAGSADGNGAAARFNFPGSVTVDPATGNLYVADTLNHTIRKITPTGDVSTLAGSAGVSGTAGGSFSAARFFLPLGVTWSSFAGGTIIVSDTFNNAIRLVALAPGSVLTQIGQVGKPGSADGGFTVGKLGFPFAAVMVGGTYYVADTSNATIRKYLSADLTTLAGVGRDSVTGTTDGTGAAARFGSMEGAVVAPNGDLFVADTYNHTIRKITPAGVVTTLAGSPGLSGKTDGTGAAARFLYPTGMAIDAAGNLYVADTDNHLIRRITPAGVVTTVAAGVVFYFPYDVAVDATGNLFVADTGNHTIRKITPQGVATIVAGTAGTSGSKDGTGSAALFSSPQALVLDAAGNLYVADSGNDTVRKITPAGVVTTLAGDAGFSGRNDGTGPAAHFNNPVSLAIDAAGNLFVADNDNEAVRRVTPAGVVTTLAGSPGSPGSADGTGASALLESPAAVALAPDGTLYITSGPTVRKAVLAGVAPTITTQPSSQSVTAGGTVVLTGAATGTPTPAYQWNLNGVAVSGATSASLTLTNVQASNAGSYTLVATNSAGAATSTAAVLTVTATPAPAPTPTPSSGGGGGGGGAPSHWFWALLAALALGRTLGGRRRIVAARASGLLP